MKIGSGIFRGKKINFDNKKFGDADITPQKIKGAVFSMMGENLNGKSFLDVFGGSGQISYDAISRGADFVVVNESDKLRNKFISKFIDSLNLVNSVVVYNKKWNQLLNFLVDQKNSFDVIFLDPPYIKDGDDEQVYSDLLKSISDLNLLNVSGQVYVQYFSKNVLPEIVGKFTQTSSKAYGASSISVYEYTQ